MYSRRDATLWTQFIQHVGNWKKIMMEIENSKYLQVGKGLYPSPLYFGTLSFLLESSVAAGDRMSDMDKFFVLEPFGLHSK